MSKVLQVIILITLLCSLAANFALNKALLNERTRPLVFEARADLMSGDVQVRLRHRPEEIATFPEMCHQRYSL